MPLHRPSRQRRQNHELKAVDSGHRARSLTLHAVTRPSPSRLYIHFTESAVRCNRQLAVNKDVSGTYTNSTFQASPRTLVLVSHECAFARLFHGRSFVQDTPANSYCRLVVQSSRKTPSEVPAAHVRCSTQMTTGSTGRTTVICTIENMCRVRVSNIV